MMPAHARWFAGSAEGRAEAYAAAERLPRAEGPRGRCLGVRVRRVARKGRFTPPGLAGSCATAGGRAGSRASPTQGPLRHPRRADESGTARRVTRTDPATTRVPRDRSDGV